MAIKATRLQVLWWKLKCSGLFQFPLAFWFGFWFASGAYWAIVAIGWATHVGQLLTDLIFS